MNIFVLDEDPVTAARMLCDQHVVKMPIEAAQMLCGLMNDLGIPAPWALGATHHNHPCFLWLCADRPARRGWLLRHALELCAEHVCRFDRTEPPKVEGVLRLADRALRRRGLADDGPVDRFAEAFGAFERPPNIDSVEAYRAYMDHKRVMWDAAGRPMRYHRIELEPVDPAPWRVVQ